ncbi:hypothetical protein PV11_03468 [Exophiala sideris]|uniref:Uncharacterized protein n=1 Tax=Exophiala sideris TaxID=1016849 RepID=A0A0D1X1B3_9EURO|nr:hypothetical protein PV11_03468 [Exophiala sideris]
MVQLRLLFFPAVSQRSHKSESVHELYLNGVSLSFVRSPAMSNDRSNDRAHAHAHVQPQPDSRDAFEIAIICALRAESDTVETIFDQFYEKEVDYVQISREQNSNSSARIGRHNESLHERERLTRSCSRADMNQVDEKMIPDISNQ